MLTEFFGQAPACVSTKWIRTLKMRPINAFGRALLRFRAIICPPVSVVIDYFASTSMNLQNHTNHEPEALYLAQLVRRIFRQTVCKTSHLISVLCGFVRASNSLDLRDYDFVSIIFIGHVML